LFFSFLTKTRLHVVRSLEIGKIHAACQTVGNYTTNTPMCSNYF
jgi:hypothetical protein